MTTSTTLITGNTYPHRDALKALGGVWDAAHKGWNVPAGKADEARAIVAATPGKAAKTKSTTGSRRGAIKRPRALREGERLIARDSRGRMDRPRDPGEKLVLKDGSDMVVVDGGRCRAGDAGVSGWEDDWVIWHIVRA